ncbi:MAG: Xaa-Pro peptidase family protein [Candidatus Aminicenantes bacterium]|nr:Xaa-Pro peptidase family protein [Candidatus Aminicenantes bacterium]
MEKEKIAQAIEILNELDIDLWMVIDRESGIISDPVMDFVVGCHATWLSFFLFSRSKETHAIVGNLDVETFRRAGLFDRVAAYKGSPREDLLRLLQRLAPRKIAIDYSPDCAAADGLTHGNYLKLLELLQGTVFADRLVSAENVIAKLRGRKSAEEIRRLRTACEKTLDIYGRVAKAAKPGMSEKELAGWITRQRERMGLEAAWDIDSCPAVFSGPQEVGAHSAPTGNVLKPGHIFNIDFGVKVDKYCSDLQRTWYILRPGENNAPPDVQRGFAVLLESIRLAFAALKPGARGLDIDRIARQAIVSQGYDEYPHALGHQVGRDAHDGGALLAPDWERYGNLPFVPLEKDQVFTIEPRIYIKDYGVATVEEMAVITANGAEYLSRPQQELLLIKPGR